MGHFIFLILHILAALFFIVGLVVTIPLHLIYAVMAGNREAKPNRWTHVKCPDCKELVLREATICKHCGCKLVPQ